MRVHWFQHVPFEGLAGIEPWLMSQGHVVTGTELFRGKQVPDTDRFDFLIVMGGPMSVHDESSFRWLRDEKRAIEKAFRAGKPVLGVCLGAQLIADVLGARVYRNRHKEIGWFPVELTDQGVASGLFAACGRSFQAFHWHGDTFDIPRGALHLARSSACENQAFMYGKHVVGLQFHLDSTRESIRALIANCGDELVPGPYIQSVDEMLGAEDRFENLHAVLDGFLREYSMHPVAGWQKAV
jgi:GMP synthase (glutamine-hydrolysing)